MELQQLIDLRQKLHSHPECSGSETNTARIIKSFLRQFPPDKLVEQLGGHGLAAIYEYSQEGPCVGIRCELDALPIQEKNDFAHQSQVSGVSHKCGHDGHMAIVCGLARWLKSQSFSCGRVVLLFQPAEETGQGASKVLEDQRFTDLNIDFLFALHNIPSEPMHQVIKMDQGFSAEVQSFELKLYGKESHAAEPEKGINPAFATAKLVEAFSQLVINDPYSNDFAVLTPVHIHLGDTNYGISPAKSALHYTIRTWSPSTMKELVHKLKRIAKKICSKESLGFEFNFFEHFPASKNHIEANVILSEALNESDYETQVRPHPFKFGEDFGWYSKTIKTSMFGLGSGLNTPTLHNAHYDFPDEIIETGMAIFKRIISKVLAD